MPTSNVSRNKCGKALKDSLLVVLCVWFLWSSVGTVAAQMSSLNAFSPYTMYGLGELAVGGNAFNRPMGGVGIAYRNPHQFNYLNPASMSVMPRQSAIFNFAGLGKNIYSKSAQTSTSYNTYTLHDLGLGVPLGKGVGLGFSLTPVSSVGYATQMVEQNDNVTEDIGTTYYNYGGDGGITQVAMNLGVQVVKGFSLGVSMYYWFGNIERQYNATLGSYLTPTTYRSVTSVETQNISRILFNFGAQYAVKVGKSNALSFGVTYQPKVTTSVKQTRQTMTFSSSSSDTVFSGNSRWNMDIPAKLSAGMCFQTVRFTAAFDYNRQNWAGAFPIPTGQDITLGVQQDFRLGFSYAPNPYDIRNPLNRWTYKLGLRYGESYLSKGGHQLRDAAVSLGVDFALKRGTFSRVGIGVEYGERGSWAKGQIHERYFNFFTALSLFGNDYWFVRPKYN